MTGEQVVAVLAVLLAVTAAGVAVHHHRARGGRHRASGGRHTRVWPPLRRDNDHKEDDR